MTTNGAELLITNDPRFRADVIIEAARVGNQEQSPLQLGEDKTPAGERKFGIMARTVAPMLLPPGLTSPLFGKGVFNFGFDLDVLLELGKGVGRSAFFVGNALVEGAAELERRAVRNIEARTGKPFPLMILQQKARDAHKRMKEVTTGEGFLAPAPQDRIFPWDDPKWWAGKAGESIAFLAAVVVPTVVVGRTAGGAGIAPIGVKSIQAAMTFATSSMIEANLTRPEMVEALVQRGLTQQEAELIASTGARGVGAISGLLDILGIQRILKGIPGGRAGAMKLFIDIVTEFTTGSLQEVTQIAGEVVLDIEDDPSQRGERILAAGSGEAAGIGPVSIAFSAVQGRANVEEAKNEVESQVTKEALDAIPPEARAETISGLQRELKDAEGSDPLDIERVKAFIGELQKRDVEDAAKVERERPPLKEVAEVAPGELIPVTFVGVQKGKGDVPENKVNTPDGTTVSFDPAKHRVTGVDAKAKEGTIVPTELQQVEAPLELPDTPNVASARRGMMDLGPIMAPVRLAADVARRGTNLMWLSMPERLQNKGGAFSRDVADQARRAIDRTKKALGDMSGPLLAAKKATSGRNLLTQRALIQLQDVQWVGAKLYGTSKMYDAIEGRVQNLSPRELKIVESIRDLVEARGVEYEKINLQQYDPVAQEWVDFQVRGRNIAPRIMHPEGMDAIIQGSGPTFTALVNAIADLNSVPRDVVAKALENARQDIEGKGAQSSFGRTQAEFSRVFKLFPSALRVDGRTVQILESNPHSYVTRLANLGAARIGYVSEFGQGVQGDQALQKIREGIRKEGGDVEAFEDLSRVLNGLPAERPLVDPGSPMAIAVRGWKGLQGIYEAGLMTLSVIPNLFEPLGTPQALSGSLDLVKAHIRMIGSPVRSQSLVMGLGAITPDVANLSYDQQRPFTSISRWIKEALSRVTARKFVEEYQERLGAELAVTRVERMKQRDGSGGSGDVIDLMTLMRWDLSKAKRVAQGGGTNAEHEAIIRRTPAAMTAGAIQSAEKSRASQNRIYRANVRLIQYADAKMRTTLNLSESMDVAFKSRDAKLMFAAVQKMTRYLVGTTASGALSYLMLAMVTGGLSGLKIKWEEMKDNPWIFFRDSFLYSMIGGPLGQVIRIATSGNGGMPFWQQAMRMSMPAFIFDEVRQLVMEQGPYTNRGWASRVGYFFQRSMPMTRITGTIMATMGLGQDDFKMRTAVSAYWRWRFQEKPPGRTSAQEVDIETKRFRRAMGSAYRAFRNGDDMVPFLVDALQIPDFSEKNVRASLRRRRLLVSLTDEEQISLRDRIGDDAFDQIILHDAILQGWADSFKAPKRLK